MININEIHSLTEFQRDAKAHLRRLKKTGRPTVLTVNGRPSVVVQDASAYQELLDQLERADAIAGIQRGLASAARGEGRPMREALADLRKKLRIPKA